MAGTPHVRFVAALLFAALPFGPAVGTALAVDLFVKPSGTGTTCVQAAPCTLATALATATNNDTIYVGAGTYTGTGTEVVLLDKTVNLLGGWDGAASGPIVRDHVVNTSTLDGENARRVITVIGAGTAPVIDGFSIIRGNASGLTAHCNTIGADNGCGGGILVYSAGPTISDNHISGNVATTAELVPGSPGEGGGIAVAYGHDLVIRGNTISGNTASTANQGFGGGIGVEYCYRCRIEGNRIIGNVATTVAGSSWGGGIGLQGDGSTVTVTGNLVKGNSASAGAGAMGNALFIWYPTVDASENLFAADHAGDTVYLGRWRGTFARNRVEATAAGTIAVGLWYQHNEETAVTNNVLAGGTTATVYAKGSAQDPVVAALKHNTIVGNGAATGVLADDFATVTMVDNIVAGHAIGLSSVGSGSIAADHTLFWNNDADGIRGTDPVDGDPKFVNRAFGDLHIQDGSVAQGHGTDAGVATDLDGDTRPGLGGFDIGADELAPARFDFGTPTSPVATSYTRVSHATAYTAERGFGWVSGTIGSRDRVSPSELLRDFCFTPLGTFAVDTPNGRYRVTVTTGDLTAGHSQMGIFLEGRQVASVSTQANEFKTLTFDISVTDGQLTLLLDDLGGSDPNVVIDALVVERMPAVRLDLGTAGSPVAGGYTRVTPAALYSPEAGSGWFGGIVQARDRGVGSALLRDFNFLQRAYFGMYLQDGLYDLSLTFGDATGAHDNMSVALQAQSLGSLTSTAANQFITRTYQACVVNNFLRIDLVDAGGKDPNVVVDAIELTPRALPRFDFGTPTSPVAEGYVQVTPATAYAAWRSFGWLSGTLSSRDRGAGSDPERDFVFTKSAEFAVDVLDGVYDVSITMGDSTGSHDLMAITLEGALVDTVSTHVPLFTTRTYRVRVTGGQLNLALADQGGTDPNVVINALEIR
jgi:fibronectin type 3 domain-containing protein